MKSRTILTIGLSLALAAILGFAVAGDLEPPGPPAPTMKTLQQVEPRTPLEGPLPITITDPGAYYLTETLVHAAAGPAITIAVESVDLDLNGFTLVGTFAAGSIGVEIDSVIRASVHGGGIGGMETAVVVRNAGFVDLSDLYVTQIQDTGVDVDDSFNVRIRDSYADGGPTGVAVTNSNRVEVVGNSLNASTICLTANFSEIDVSENHFAQCGAAAIFPSQNVNGTIAHNRLINSGADVIFLGDQVNMSVTHNIIHRAFGKGIDANSLSTQGTIAHNEVYDTTGFGIESASSQISTYANRIGRTGGGYNLPAGPRVAPVASLSSGPSQTDNVDTDLP